ncbi:MAG: hypothetical protein RIS86_1975 [Planctomycetota bacterium]
MSGSGSPRATHVPARSAAWAVAAVFAAPVLALVLSGANAGRAAFDSIAYHEHFIRQLAEDAPRIDLSNPLTATTPGFHMLIAAASVAGLESTTSLRLVAAAIGVALVWWLARWCERSTGSPAGAVLALPLAASVYVIGSGAWLLPDDLAWLLVGAVLAICLRPKVGPRDLALASALLVPLVLVRQTHLWAAALVWAAAMRPRGDEPITPARAVRAALPWIVATVPAFATVGAFARHWGGLVPPRFQGELQSLNPATPAFLLLQVAILSLGFLPWIARAVRLAFDRSLHALIAGGLAGLLLAAIPTTTENIVAGRYSGWWTLVGRAPTIGGRMSLAMLVLAPVGAMVVVALVAGLGRGRRIVAVAAILAFGGAVTLQHYAWQRYHEPFILLLLPMLCVLQEDGWRWRPRMALAPLALVAVSVVVCVRSLDATPVAQGRVPPARHRAEGDRFYLESRRLSEMEVAAGTPAQAPG